MGALEVLILRLVAAGLFLVAVHGVYLYAFPERLLTPVALALPADSLPRREAVGKVRQGAAAEIVLGGLGGLILFSMAGMRLEIIRLREALEEATRE